MFHCTTLQSFVELPNTKIWSFIHYHVLTFLQTSITPWYNKYAYINFNFLKAFSISKFQSPYHESSGPNLKLLGDWMYKMNAKYIAKDNIITCDWITNPLINEYLQNFAKQKPSKNISTMQYLSMYCPPNKENYQRYHVKKLLLLHL